MGVLRDKAEGQKSINPPGPRIGQEVWICGQRDTAERITTKEKRIAKALFSLTVALHETVCSLTCGWEGIRILSQFQAISKLL